MTTSRQQCIAIENRLNKRPNNYFDPQALQVAHDVVWLLGRVGALESELHRQWRANHAAHCGQLPAGADDCPRQECGCPKPDALVGASV
jgi:hypothetical protein